MAEPKSLLQMAGAPLTPAPLDKAALVLIDIQREYSEGGLKLPGVGAAVDEAAKLLTLARAKGVPVFHIVHHGRPGGALFNPEGPMSEPVAAVAPKPGETVVPKGLPNAFAKTELDALIKKTGRGELIVAGFMTHLCVSASVRAALDLGYRTTLVASATGTRDLPDPLGGVQQANQVHRAALAALADRFAIVVKDASAWS